MSLEYFRNLKQLKRIAFTLFIFMTVTAVQHSYAQTNSDKENARLRYEAELRRKDSIIQNAKLKRKQDSLKRVLQKEKMIRYRDSMKLVLIEKRRQDSITRAKLKLKMLEERRIRDSTRLAKQDELKRMIAERKRVADSIRVVRKARTDSLSQARAEARRVREALKKYKSSRRYKDSVAQVRQARRDSIKSVRDTQLAKIKAERKRIIDSTKEARTEQITKLKNERKRVMDSTIAARKAYTDSLKLARKKMTDALKLARKKRKDSLENERSKSKVAAKKKKTQTELTKEKADKIHARKQGSWTNEKLLKKGWNIKRRIWQNTVTRYNSYYNADRKYKEAIKRLKERYKETYTEQISIYPFNLESSLSAIGNDMDTVIKKCAYDTHIHDPRSKWFDNIYLLMGKAFFFKNDYDGAITALQYVVNEYKNGDKKQRQKKGFVKLPELNEIEFDKENKVRIATEEKRTGLKLLAHHPIRNEALIWLARAHTKNKQFSEAQSLLSILEEDKVFPDRLRDDLYFAWAEFHFEQGNNLSAIEPLEKAVKEDAIKQKMKNRANYLLAQLYAQDGNLALSNKYLQEALKAKLPLEMEYFAKLSLAQNAIAGNGDKETAIAQLESLAKEDKYDKWRAQSYLSLGQILQDSQPEKAIKSFDQALQSEKNKNLKAAAFLGKGEIFYKQANYPKAKIAYDSVVIFSKKANPPINNMEQVTLRKEVLESLIKFTDIIRKEDSLQALSKKSRKEQIAIIKKELKRIEREKRDKLKAESAKLTAVQLTPGKFGKNAWYFYNNSTVQQGLVEFKTKWGERKLTDNWRRSGGQGIGSGLPLAGNDSSGSGNEKNLTRNSAVKKLLNQLYSTPQDFENSDVKIKDAYFQLALIYSSRLQEFKTSIETFEALNLRFPKHKQLAASYYSMSLSHTERKEIAKAKALQEKIKKEFPNSEFADLLNGNSKEQNLANQEIAVLYDTAYHMLQRYEYGNVFKNATASLEQYPNNLLKSKFELLQAKSLAGLKQYDSSIILTQNIIKNYPGSKEQQHAQDFLRYLKSAKTGNDLATNNKNDKSGNSNKKKDPSAVYTHDIDEAHFYLLYLTKIDGNTLALKSGFSDYNVIKHSQKKLKTNMNLITAKSGALTIVQFKNADRAERYAKQVRNEPKLFSRVNGSDFKAMTISKSNFRELLKTRKVAEYLKFYKERY